MTLAAELLRHKPDHPPLTLLFTVREESGLWGARYVNPKDLGGVKMGFNYDGRKAADVIIGAVGADRWEVEIFGRASHAGGAPERGISATMILAEAWRPCGPAAGSARSRRTGAMAPATSARSAGPTAWPAGDATNVVTDYVLAQGESRSHDAKFVREITAAYKAAFAQAAADVKNSAGQSRSRQIQEPNGLQSLPDEGDGAGRPSGGGCCHRTGQ